MPILKIPLEPAEFEAVQRLAGQVGACPEDVVYAALSRLMKRARNRHVRNDIVLLRRSRLDKLPDWSDGPVPVAPPVRPMTREAAHADVSV